MEASNQLPNDLAALVHQVELNDPGWRAEMIKKVVVLTVSNFDGTTSKEAIRKYARTEYDVVLSLDEVEKVINQLENEGDITTTSSGLVRISEKKKSRIREHVEDARDIEDYSKNYFEQILRRRNVNNYPDNVWELFKEKCLIPTLKELGARTFRIISGNGEIRLKKETYKSFLEIFDKQERANGAVRDFLQSEDEKVRSYVLRSLHAYLLTYANDLGEEEINRIRNRTNINAEINIFLDTNFLFSVFKIHNNPANPAVDHLMRTLFELEEGININFYVHPITLHEFKSTLNYYKDKLSGIDISGSLEESVSSIEGEVSGVTSRYLREAQKSESISTAKEFLLPFLEDPLSLARERNIEIYREDIDYLKEREVVEDDISEIYRRKRSKSIDAAEHDALMWHFLKGKRGGYAQNPLDAGYWFATVDSTLIEWEESKISNDGDGLPVCLAPSDLLQMIQVWVPRSEEMKDAMFNSVVSLLPSYFDPQAEQVTIDILDTISDFEGHKQIPSDAISNVLLNRAIRSEIKSTNRDKEREKIIENSFHEEIRRKHEEIEDLKDEIDSLSSEMKDEREEKEEKIESLRNEIDNIREGFREKRKELRQEANKARDKLSEKEDEVEDTKNKYRDKKSQVWWRELVLVSGLEFIVVSVLTYMCFSILEFFVVDKSIGFVLSLTTSLFFSIAAFVEANYWFFYVTSELHSEWLVEKISKYRGRVWAVFGLVISTLVGNTLWEYFLGG